MAPQILMVVHQESSDPGLVGEMLSQRGYQLDIRCPAQGDRLPPSMEHHQAAVIFGGPMSANDDNTLPFIKAELDWIPIPLGADKPFLGICLGAQLLARALGATVAPHSEERAEIGYFPLFATEKGHSIMKGLSHVYHWHQEGFELPSSATLLATGHTFPHQAFRYGEQVYGLQFHPEINQGIMERWITKAADQLDQLTGQGAQPRDEHFQNHAHHGPGVKVWLDQFLDSWLEDSVEEGSLESMNL